MPEWVLSYPGTELAFGDPWSSYVFPVAPDVGPPEIAADDTPRPRADGVAFGVDTFGSRTVTFEINVIGDDCRESAEVLARAWRADPVRQGPGSVAQLRSDIGRVAFGRPRRYVADNNYRELIGRIRVVADFACADTLWYGAESSASVSLVPAPGGGLIAPLASPLATTATSDRSTVFTVGGEVPTWPTFEIQGPITNPVIEIVGLLRMEFRTTLAFDQSIVIDTRSWARSILRNGASIAGTLSRTSTRLSQASIPPGSYELVLRGASDSGTSSVNIRWRDAYLTP